MPKEKELLKRVARCYVYQVLNKSEQNVSTPYIFCAATFFIIRIIVLFL